MATLTGQAVTGTVVEVSAVGIEYGDIVWVGDTVSGGCAMRYVVGQPYRDGDHVRIPVGVEMGSAVGHWQIRADLLHCTVIRVA